MGQRAEPVTYAAYLEFEASAETRHEYVDGQILAMAGGSIRHGRLIGRLVEVLRAKLRGRGCTALASDVRVRIRAADRTTYPDVFIVCGEIQHDADDVEAVTNPTVVFEVLSPTTEHYDRRIKSADYRRLPSVRETVLISQTERRVERVTRGGPRRWVSDEFLGGESVELASVGISLDVDELFVDELGVIVAPDAAQT
jgi:Uma2 family endonuclease